MKKRGIFTLMMLLVFAFAFSIPISAKAATYKWVSLKNGDKQCYKNGKLVKNKWVDNRHLNSEGYMDRNKWVSRKINGVNKTVFVRNDGKMVENFKAGWQKIGKKYYYYTSKGVLVKNRWITVPLIGKYYVNAKGYRVTGLKKFKDGYRYFDSNGLSKTGWQTINGKKYYFQSGSRLALTNGFYRINKKKTYAFNSSGQRVTGWRKKSGKYYYFKPDMKTGWLTVKGKKYYLTSKGARVTGVYGIGGKLYYFNNKGVMQTNKAVTYQGRKYLIDKKGQCSLVPDGTAPSSKMLFFLTFESGSEAYKQTGGDNGNACGAYQFDYRYSLLNFVKYAYGRNAQLCAEFKTYAGYPDNATYRAKLHNNKTFYKAWKKIYKRNPAEFAQLQDTFAKSNYYDPVESQLARAGINLGVRSDVVKGAVYSYSIQHGQSQAVAAVKACKIKSTTSDKQFLKKLYTYRKKEYPAYKSRYSSEYSKALSLL